MITAGIITVVVVVVVAALIAAGTRRNRHAPDNIASFRRQINALSPEARRQTSDRMKPSERSASGDDGADDT